jgi:citrate synthase
MRKRFTEGFHYDAHPMGMLMSAIAGLSTYYPENFLSMMWRIAEPQYRPDPVLTKALDVLLILHADHEQNCSTSTMRMVGSSHADPYSSAAAATGALYGPRHGGANEAVIHMLGRIGTLENVEPFVESVKRGEELLWGFGHRVYKAYDPRAAIVKSHADRVFAVTGKSPLLDIALKLEEIALADDYFKSRNLYPNVDFYTGLICQAMNFPLNMFTVLFTIGRMPGWLAHWQESLEQNSKISRPRQIYTGETERAYTPITGR